MYLATSEVVRLHEAGLSWMFIVLSLPVVAAEKGVERFPLAPRVPEGPEAPSTVNARFGFALLFTLAW